MSNKWVQAPRVRPHVCASCRRGGAEHGPYWESAFHYPDSQTGAELRHYTCIDCARAEFLAEGSPFAALVLQAQAAQTCAQDERDLADAAALELREALEAANARIGMLEGQAFPSAHDIADIVAQRITGAPPPRQRAGSRR